MKNTVTMVLLARTINVCLCQTGRVDAGDRRSRRIPSLPAFLSLPPTLSLPFSLPPSKAVAGSGQWAVASVATQLLFN